VIVNFGAAPDHYEDWTFSSKPRNASATEGSGVDPNITVGGIATANPADPKKNSPGSLLITGVIENGSNGGDGENQPVHTLSDIAFSAWARRPPRSARVRDTTGAYFYIMNAFPGFYPIPPHFWGLPPCGAAARRRRAALFARALCVRSGSCFCSPHRRPRSPGSPR